jgi:membrane protein
MTKLPSQLSKVLAEARIKLRPLRTRERRKAYARSAHGKWSRVAQGFAKSRKALKAGAEEMADIVAAHHSQAEERTRNEPDRLRQEGQQAHDPEPKKPDAGAQKRQEQARRKAREAYRRERASAERERKASQNAKRRGGKAKPAPRKPAKPRPERGGVDALGWFALAAVILAWPREGGLFGPRDPNAPALFPGLGRPASETEVAAAAAREPGRGRAAQSPGQIPLEGWKDILARTWHDFNEDKITSVAGGVTFFGLLALFPAMGAFVSLYGLFADVGTAQKQLTLLAGVLPASALTFVGQEMVRLAAARGSSLGIAFIFGLLISIWSANAGVKALFEGLNVALEEKEKRNFVKLNLVSLAFTVGAMVFLLLALGAVVVLPVIMDVFGIGAGSLMPVLRWPLLFVVVVFALAVLYRYGPSRSHEKWKWVTWGSVIAAVLWLIASLLLSLYVSHFAHYDKTYGSLGAVIGFMTWMWVSTIVVLFGAELNSEIEHQTAVDTTSGSPKLMGTRGAKMADTLGEARQPKKSRR